LVAATLNGLGIGVSGKYQCSVRVTGFMEANARYTSFCKRLIEIADGKIGVEGRLVRA
jgi:hypothetical protein